MPSNTADILTVAVAVIALSQFALVLVLLSALRRLRGELSPLLAALGETNLRLQEALERITALAEQTGDTVEQARRAAAHVGAVAGAGRAILESAVVQALLGRLGGGAAGGTASLVRTAATLAAGLYQGYRRRRARQGQQDPPPTGMVAGTQALDSRPPRARAGRVGSVRRARPDRGAGIVPGP